MSSKRWANSRIILLVLLAFGCHTACPNDELCREKFHCISCQNSYLDAQSDSCVPASNKIYQCLSYDSVPPHRCIECQVGFYTDKSGNCIRCGEDCMFCTRNECTGCSDRWIPKENGCQNSDRKCSDANCQACNKDDKCQICDNGYSFDQTGECIRSFDYCLKIDANENCVRCWNGFFLDNNFRCVSVERNPAAWYFFGAFFFVLVFLGITIFMKKESSNRRKFTEDSLISLG